MADYGANYTDQELAKLEKRIKKVYGEAAKDIETKMNSFTAKSKAKEQKYLQKVANGEMTQAEFDKWKAGQVFQGKQWQAKKEEIATVLYNANTVASNMANNTQFNVFAANANFAAYQLEHDAGVNFGFALYDQNTVSRLIKDEPNLLPNYKPKKSKDMTWNSKKITNQITQGIIQGESLDKISKRLATVTASQNMNSMKTHARTLMTGAQNAGRLQSYENAQKIGIDVEKEWMATLDSRTRDSHARLDGETVPIDKPFSNGLMYPGDPDGNPREVYNCFIPETNIASDSEIIRSYKHYYSGKLISIKSARGVNFSCTPNHPILTDRGWVAAKFLNEGDNLIVTSSVNNEVSRRNPNINHAFPRIDAIHELFYIMGGKRTSDLRVNFHGDIPTTEVEIITQKRFLRSNFNISVRKCINKFLLKYANSPLMRKCSFMKHFECIMRTAFSNIGSVGKPFSFIGRSLCHSNIHRFRSVPNVDIGLPEYSINDLPTNPDFFGESLIGLTGKIFLDDIISVDVSDFTGHVYNLQTKNNYYFVNNNTNNAKSYNDIFAIAHNCRCTMVSDIKKYPSIYNRYNNETRERIRNMSYKDWEDAKKSGKTMAPYSINKITLGNLFDGLSQNGAYTKIHDVDTSLSNQFYKELQKMGQQYDLPVKPAQVWKDYLNDNLPVGTSGNTLEEIMVKYKAKASKVSATLTETLATEIDYSKYGGKEIFDILNKYDGADQLFLFGEKDFDKVWEFTQKNNLNVGELMKDAKAAKNGLPGSAKAPKTAKAVKTTSAAEKAVSKPVGSADNISNEWINRARSNPDVDGMLKLEEESFKKFTGDEVDALRTYTGSSYTKMNGYLRNTAKGMSEAEALSAAGISDPWLTEQIELCQDALGKSKLGQELVLRRGTDVGDLAGLFMEGDFDTNYRMLTSKPAEELNDMFQGAVGQWAGFTSTSSQWDRGFSGDVECVILAPEGTQAASIMGISRYGTGEGETLLNAGTKVVCEKVEKSDGHKGSDIRVFLRIIP